MNPENPTHPAVASPAPHSTLGRAIHLAVVAFVFGLGVMLLAFVIDAELVASRPGGDYRNTRGKGLLALACFAAVAGAWFVLAWRLGWSRRKVNLWGAAAFVLATTGIGLFVRMAWIQSANSAIASNLSVLAANADAYYLENGMDALVSLDELVGPDNYVKSVSVMVGEDYRTLFPRRQFDVWVVSGGAAGRRVWFRDHVGMSAPVPNGRYRSKLAEVNYRDGRPHGAHRVFDHEKRLRFEVVYESGRLVSGRVVAADGRTERELTDPATARQAFDETLAAVLAMKSQR